MASTTTPSSSTRDTALAAVTTIFTPPSFCDNYVDEDMWFSSRSELSLGSCFPGEPLKLGLVDWYYSPAICPSGYTPGCTLTEFDLDPPFLSGETAIICCPSAFNCAHITNQVCVSDDTTALSVHIRWQESDLSEFETPPLADGLPTSQRHAGWGPAGALTTVHILPDDCLEATDTWLGFDQQSCRSLNEGYYSPGICPEGWTAAFTRPVLGDYGPPEEPDETAMFCCPSGMGPIPGEDCGPQYCVSTTITTWLDMLSVSLLMAREPIQIRWSSSDLSILETHPLAPGMVPTERTETQPVTPGTAPTETTSLLGDHTGILPEFESTASKAVGLAFIPAALALLVVSGLLFLRRRRGHRYSGVPMASGPISIQRSYRPWILTWPPLSVLIAIAVTSIVLLELSCHYLPTEHVSLQKRGIQPTKVYLQDVTIQKRQSANATFQVDDMKCSPVGSVQFSPVITQNRGTTITTGSAYAESTACEIHGTPVDLPTCAQTNYGDPSSAPDDGAWLSEASGSPSERFVASMLGPMLSVLFAIPWKILHLHATSLEPFHKLSSHSGTTVTRAVLQSYSGLGSVFGTVPFLTACLSYGSAILAPLAAEAWNVGLVGPCLEDAHDDCPAQMQAVPSVIRTMEALLAVLVLLGASLVIVLRRWSTGVVADPRSIVGISSLAQSPDLRGAFGSLLVDGTEHLNVADMKSRIGGLNVCFSGAPSRNVDYGIMLLTRPEHGQGKWGKRSRARRLAFTVKLTLLGIAFAAFIIALDTLVIYYRVTGGDTGFEKFMSSQGFGPRFLFSACGVVISFVWAQIFSVTTCLAPYYSMSKISGQPGNASVLRPYATDPYSDLLRTLLNRQFFLSLVSLVTIFSDFLPLLLANVPFHRTRTLIAHLVSSWMTVAILSLMIIVLIGLLVVIYTERLGCSELLDVLAKTPMAGVLVILSQSGEFVGRCRGLSFLSREERDCAVEEMGHRYYLETNADETTRNIALKIQR